MDNLNQLLSLLGTQNTASDNSGANLSSNQDFQATLNNIISSINQNTPSQGTPNQGTPDIASIINNVLSSTGQASSTTKAPQNISDVLNGLNLSGGGDLGSLATTALPLLSGLSKGAPHNARGQLLNAAKPFLSESFSPHIDRGLRMVSTARTIKSSLAAVGGLNGLFKL